MIQYYDIKLERALLRAIIHVKGIIKEIYEDKEFGVGVFVDKSHKNIYNALMKYWQKYGVAPSEELFQTFIINFLDSSKILTKQQNLL